MGGGGDFGGGLDSSGTWSDDMGDIGGEEGSMPTGDMGGDAVHQEVAVQKQAVPNGIQEKATYY